MPPPIACTTGSMDYVRASQQYRYATAGGGGGGEGDDNEGARLRRIKKNAQEYFELTADYAVLQKDVADLKQRLIRDMRQGEGVEVSPNTVLALVEKPNERKLITQKLLREVGVPLLYVNALLEATSPQGARTLALKTMLTSEFDARTERDASGGGAGQDG